jgi:hypothetical protein
MVERTRVRVYLQQKHIDCRSVRLILPLKMPSPISFGMFELLLLFSVVRANRNPPNWIYAVESANIDSGIHCEGDYPPHPPQVLLPWENVFYGHLEHGVYRSLAHICLSITYGGQPQNLGGTCSPTATDPFSISFLPDQLFHDLGTILYCKTKCWCTGGSGRPVRPASGYGQRGEIPTRNSFYRHFREFNSIVPMTELVQIALNKFADLEFLEDVHYLPARIQLVHLAGLASEQLVCDEAPIPLVNFPLSSILYATLLEFCAASMYGGSQIGNMGGFCSRTAFFGSIWNQDEDLTHPVLIGDHLAKAYCFAKCYCVGTLPPPPIRTIPFARRFMVDTSGVDVKIYDMRSPSEGDLSITILTQASGGEGSTQGSTQATVNLTAACDGQDSIFCNSARPKDQQAISINTRSRPLSSHTRNAKPRGGLCRGSCSDGVACGMGCSCTVDLSVEDLHQHGQNPLFPAAICLAISITTAIGSKGLGGGRRRSLGSDQQQMACVCNATYVSFGCCGSQTGIIWESREDKLGELKV